MKHWFIRQITLILGAPHYETNRPNWRETTPLDVFEELNEVLEPDNTPQDQAHRQPPPDSAS